MLHLKIAGAWPVRDICYALLLSYYFLMLNTKSYSKIQSCTTKPLCYQTCNVSATKTLSVR